MASLECEGGRSLTQRMQATLVDSGASTLDRLSIALPSSLSAPSTLLTRVNLVS